jgi:hypothetical protein
MFFENLVKTEKEIKGSQQIMFVDLPADKRADKDDGKFQISLEIIYETSEQLFAENAFGEFQYLGRE